MEIAGLGNIDWSAPWLTSLAGIGQAVASRDWRGALNHASKQIGLRNHRGHPIVFTEGDAAGAGEPYESFIARTGCVPTRGNVHDYFNALMFLQFPHAKAQLNHLQSRAIDRDGIHRARGPVRDAATLIDENGLLLVTRRTDLIDLARLHDWSALFVRQRDAWHHHVAAHVFGHALLEKLVRPFKAITAHALHVPLDANSSLVEVDLYLAASFGDDLSPLQLIPVPVLGIPGWYAPNANPDFYRDAKVFRPANMRRP